MSTTPNNLPQHLLKLRRAMGLAPPTAAEADAAMANAAEVPMSDYEVRSIVESAVSGKPVDRELSADFGWTELLNTSEAENEAYAMNRNRGALDEETKKRLEELRKKALEQCGKQDDKGRMAGDRDKA
jgi:hypothetical protein